MVGSKVYEKGRHGSNASGKVKVREAAAVYVKVRHCAAQVAALGAGNARDGRKGAIGRTPVRDVERVLVRK